MNVDPGELVRFSGKYQVVASSGCWEWQTPPTSCGYGLLTVRRDGRWTKALAHRLSYEHYMGRIGDGMVIDHTCKNKMCVNPSHLEVVTQQENIMRGNGPSVQRTRHRRRTACHKGHAFTLENTKVVVTSDGTTYRRCRACIRERERAARNRKAEAV